MVCIVFSVMFFLLVELLAAQAKLLVHSFARFFTKYISTASGIWSSLIFSWSSDFSFRLALSSTYVPVDIRNNFLIVCLLGSDWILTIYTRFSRLSEILFDDISNWISAVQPNLFLYLLLYIAPRNLNTGVHWQYSFRSNLYRW